MKTIVAHLAAKPGNIVCAKLGETPAVSREICFQAALAFFDDPENRERFGLTDNMKLVVPRPPFMPNTKERWEEQGAHVTFVLQGTAAAPGWKDDVGQRLRQVI